LHTAETANFLQAFASLGVPQEIKTDNGLAYAAKELAKISMNWGVSHTFSIPHSATVQAIIERTHHI
ncbi:POK25 protein, partial [Thryothorus ludovicianus]|nr:POK25 protein [Thryothorus ludovicianus]